MGAIKEYILSISIAAIVCSVIKRLVGDKSTNGKLIKMITGVFMTITVLAPILSFKMADLQNYLHDFEISSDAITDDAILMAQSQRDDIIIQQTEAYILGEAEKMHADIQAKVFLSDSSPPYPIKIEIRGTISPSSKSKLSNIIVTSLNIAEENIEWT